MAPDSPPPKGALYVRETDDRASVLKSAVKGGGTYSSSGAVALQILASKSGKKEGVSWGGTEGNERTSGDSGLGERDTRKSVDSLAESYELAREDSYEPLNREGQGKDGAASSQQPSAAPPAADKLPPILPRAGTGGRTSFSQVRKSGR